MSASQPLRIMVMAGGTGGHVFPALAVADALRAQGVEVSWLGTRRGLEADVVPNAGFPIDYIHVSGLRGKGIMRLMTAPVTLLSALYQGLKIMRRRNPSAVLGMGGYVCGPAGLAAWISRRPLLIHEQNARAGLTNRLLAPFSKRIMQAFPGTFPANKRVYYTGNPLRKAFTENPALCARPQPVNTPLRLLVIGGSLGAAYLNRVVPAALAQMKSNERPHVWHQTGKNNIESATLVYSSLGLLAAREQENISPSKDQPSPHEKKASGKSLVKVKPFIADMAAAYRWADVVLCRSGAMTIAELAAAGVASILVPFPHAVDDHQTANARYLSDAQAALLVPQEHLNAESLRDILQSLSAERLNKMAASASKLALPKATAQVVQHCLAVARGQLPGQTPGQHKGTSHG